MTENRNNPTCRLETRHIRVSAEPIGKENAATIIRGKDLREVPKWLRAVMGRKKSVIRDRNRDARSSVFLPVFRRERHGQHRHSLHANKHYALPTQLQPGCSAARSFYHDKLHQVCSNKAQQRRRRLVSFWLHHIDDDDVDDEVSIYP